MIDPDDSDTEGTDIIPPDEDSDLELIGDSSGLDVMAATSCAAAFAPDFLDAAQHDLSLNPLLGAAAIRGCKLLLEENLYLHQRLGHNFSRHTKRIPGAELLSADEHAGFCRLEGDELVIQAEAGE
jgi:hypothetical protein